MSKILNPYKGKLTAEAVAKGFNAAIDNAVSLLEDAKILFEHNRFPTAASLAVLSIEESGKTRILRSLALVDDEAELKSLWQEYRSHRAKNGASIFLELALGGARHLQDFRETVNPKAEHTAVIDAIKQIGFYTDCSGNCHWSKPDEIIDADLANWLIKTAEVLSKKGEHVTVKEIELWIQHMKPHWKTEFAKSALIDWCKAMEAEGLKFDYVGKMEKFVN
jgi:AbiV family abortive infection protein